MRHIIYIILIVAPVLLCAQDSLTLYLNSIEVQQFYEQHGNYTLVKRRNDVKSPHWNNWRARTKYRGDKSKYYEKIDRQTYRQREVETTVLNPDAPMQLFHKKIDPMAYVQYRNDVIGSPMHADIVGLYLYSIPPDGAREKEVTQVVEVSEPEKPIETRRSLYNRPGEVIREWKDVPHLKIVSEKRGVQMIPFAIENADGARMPYESRRVPAGFQYGAEHADGLVFK